MLPSRKYHNTTSFLDVIMNTLVGFVMLFLISFVLIRPLDEAKKIETTAEFIITVTWDAMSKDDVDTWLQDPTGKIIYFQNKTSIIGHLDRDDLGQTNDSYEDRNGVKHINYSNQETITIRGFMEGEWTLNLHMYNKKDKEETNVVVLVDKLNPFENIIRKHFVMKEHWEEKTVLRFTMSKTGQIVSKDFTPKELVISVGLSNSGATTEDNPATPH